MKKIAFFILALAVLLGLLAGCNNSQQPSTQPQADSTKGGLEDSVFGENNTELPTQNTTAPTQSQPSTGHQHGTTEPTTGQQDATKPTEEEEATTPTSPITGNPDSNVISLDYKTFKAMTSAQKKAYQESFESMDAFFEWYNAAYEAYREANPPTIIDGSGTVTLP